MECRNIKILEKIIQDINCNALCGKYQRNKFLVHFYFYNVFFFAVSLVATTLYNLLDYPAGNLPVTAVTEEDIVKVNDSTSYPLTGLFEKAVKRVIDL